MKCSYRNICFFLLLFCLLTGSSCEKQKSVPGYIAKVDNEYLSAQKVIDDLDSVNIKSRKLMNEYINQWINQTMLYKEAEKRGILKSEKYLSILEETQKSIAVNILLNNEIYSKNSEIPLSEINDYYNNHKTEFFLGCDIIGISYIIFSDLGNADAFKKEVTKSLWENISEKYKMRLNKLILKSENDVIFKTAEVSPIDIWKNSVKMEPGQISAPFKVLNGYMVLKLNFKQKAGEIGNMNYARNDIKERLNIEKKRKSYLDFLRDLQTKYHPEINNDF
jgi:hypothetical protein